jgi:hypothetical protein
MTFWNMVNIEIWGFCGGERVYCGVVGSNTM